MTSTFLYGTFHANECDCSDTHHFWSDMDCFCSFDNWSKDPISENWQLMLLIGTVLVYLMIMDFIHYLFMPLISFRVPYTLDLLLQHLSIAKWHWGCRHFWTSCIYFNVLCKNYWVNNKVIDVLCILRYCYTGIVLVV